MPMDGGQTDVGEVRISGAMVQSNVRAFAEEVGDGAVQRAIESLPHGQRDAYNAIARGDWVPASLVDAVFAAIAREAGEDLDRLFPRAVERGLELMLTTVWRTLARFATDRMLLTRAPAIYARIYDRGRLEASFPRRGQAHVVLRGWPNPPRYRLLAIAAGMRAVLRLAGRGRVSVTFERTDDGAFFFASWQK